MGQNILGIKGTESKCQSQQAKDVTPHLTPKGPHIPYTATASARISTPAHFLHPGLFSSHTPPSVWLPAFAASSHPPPPDISQFPWPGLVLSLIVIGAHSGSLTTTCSGPGKPQWPLRDVSPETMVPTNFPPTAWPHITAPRSLLDVMHTKSQRPIQGTRAAMRGPWRLFENINKNKSTCLEYLPHVRHS